MNTRILLTTLLLGMCISSCSKPGPTREELILDLGEGVWSEQVTMKLVLIPAGKFMMGSPADEKGRNDNESPQHEVTISRPFYMGVTEVTREQWAAVLESTSRDFDSRIPMNVRPFQVTEAFCKALSKKTGRVVRLPTEAEWEYACRAGTTTRFSFGDDHADLHKYGNYSDQSNTSMWASKDDEHNDKCDRAAIVGRFKPNAFGLYDMHGNVWEWCSDWYGENYYRNSPGTEGTDPQGPAKGQSRHMFTGHVGRGGSWYTLPDECRAAYRGSYSASKHMSEIGFRVVVEFDSSAK